MNRKHFLLLMLFAAILPQYALAQDDLYFKPKTKAQKQAEREAYIEKVTKQWENDAAIDRYNRRGNFRSRVTPIGEEGSDIIDLQIGNGEYPDSAYNDSTLSVTPTSPEYWNDDYRYSREMSRFDDFYPRYYSPWFYDYWFSYPWYYSHWYGDPWYYSPWYDDPWYYSHWYWNRPWYSGYWGWHSAWYAPWYGPYYSFYWRRPIYVGVGGGGAWHGHTTAASMRTGRQPLAGYGNARGNVNRGNSKVNPNLSGRSSRNRSYNASERFNRSSYDSQRNSPFGGTTIDRNAGGSSSFGGSRSGSFGGGGSRGGSFGGGGSRGGGFGGRR